MASPRWAAPTPASPRRESTADVCDRLIREIVRRSAGPGRIHDGQRDVRDDGARDVQRLGVGADDRRHPAGSRRPGPQACLRGRPGRSAVVRLPARPRLGLLDQVQPGPEDRRGDRAGQHRAAAGPARLAHPGRVGQLHARDHEEARHGGNPTTACSTSNAVGTALQDNTLRIRSTGKANGEYAASSRPSSAAASWTSCTSPTARLRTPSSAVAPMPRAARSAPRAPAAARRSPSSAPTSSRARCTPTTAAS